MPKLRHKIAVVAGASRGAGRGIARALGDAGATVYVVGRTTRGGPPPPDGAPGTIEDTADEVTARGGRGIAVRADCTSEPDVAALFARVDQDHGRVDLAVAAVWGGADAFPTTDAWQAAWSRPFWEQPPDAWRHMMAAPLAYYLTACHAARLMARQRGRGLIVGVTDGILDGQPADAYGGQLLWDLSHACINRLLFAVGHEGRKHGITAITLMPGFMRTERVVRALGDDERLKKQMRFDLSETPEYLGRAVAALLGDPKAARHGGGIRFVADLAREYGFTDVDGRLVPRFNPF
ncbi:MAG: SDR family NAD(P)-dependent oxidoreductase [Acidobacteriota bacterium]